MLPDHGDIREMPVSVLAYIGDAVYELSIRLALSRRFLGKSGDLHRRSVRMVRATAQASAARMLLPQLSEEETAIFKRARNNQPASQSKHADPVDYRVATGLEALIGYLYLMEKHDRIDQLIHLILEEYQYGEKTELPKPENVSETESDLGEQTVFSEPL